MFIPQNMIIGFDPSPYVSWSQLCAWCMFLSYTVPTLGALWLLAPVFSWPSRYSVTIVSNAVTPPPESGAVSLWTSEFMREFFRHKMDCIPILVDGHQFKISNPFIVFFNIHHKDSHEMGWTTTNHIPMFDDGTYNVVLVFVNIWRFPKHTVYIWRFPRILLPKPLVFPFLITNNEPLTFHVGIGFTHLW